MRNSSWPSALLLLLLLGAERTSRVSGLRRFLSGRHIAALLGGTFLVSPSHAENVYRTSASGIEFYDAKVGEGRPVAAGDRAVIDFRGRLIGRQGWIFEDTFSTGKPAKVETADANVIEGLRLGLAGESGMPAMRDGGRRRLLIPSRLGYQTKENEPLPADFGQRQRLWSTVLNSIRGDHEREALGDALTGKLLIDVDLKRVLRTKNSVQ